MNLEKFIKLMMMTTSSHDGECLNAIRMANAELAKINNNWEDLLRSKVSTTSSYTRTQTRENDEEHLSDDEIDALFEQALKRVPKSSSFRIFVEGVHAWWEMNGFLSPAQLAAIKKAANGPGRQV